MRVMHTTRSKLLALMAIFQVVVLVALIGNTLRILNNAVVQSTQASITQTSQILNLAVTPYAASNNFEQLTDFFQELLVGNQDGLVYVVIENGHHQRLVSAGKVPPQPTPPADSNLAGAIANEVVHVRQPLLLANNQVGFLQFGLSSSLIRSTREQVISHSAIIAGVSLTLIMVALYWFAYWISRRLERVVAASQSMAAGHYQERLPTGGSDEFSDLARAFNAMAAAISERIQALEDSQQQVKELNYSLELRVEKRTEELAANNIQLASTLETLRLAQDELVRSEKMAALGSIVAGVAHELNTPLGNCLTVATALHGKTRDFKQAIQEGLKRSILAAYLDAAESATDLMSRNLSKAAELVSSFKHVAVDQTSSQRRRFNLRKTLDEIMVTIGPMLKKTPFTVTIDVADDITMDSYPGPLGQIITNFVNNAVQHGFDGYNSGEMSLSVQRDGEHSITLYFRDNGTGIAAENIKRVFDPFFTTRLGQGGSGLGLNIVYNMVTTLLGGSIHVNSQLGVGTEFVLQLPLVAPQVQEKEAHS